MIVSDHTMHAEGIVVFFKKLVRRSAKAGKKIATKVIKNPARALELQQPQLEILKMYYQHCQR